MRHSSRRVVLLGLEIHEREASYLEFQIGVMTGNVDVLAVVMESCFLLAC